ncbi:MAG: Mrp/NBP35 family ATP-binding protein [SAR324 cluster bacterium]|nr:Mrp/NBP35 family ATP-binding protein [SAR324 cluster bacterium]
MKVSQDSIVKALETVQYDQDKNLISADVIDTLAIDKQTIAITFLPTDLSSELKDDLTKKITEVLTELDGVTEVKVKFLDTKPSKPAAQQSPKRKFYFDNYQRVILVVSGKGGVGKSTCALNLALALKRIGKTVALFDADIYGPSLPLMLGLRGEQPYMQENRLIPMKKFGLEFISIGSLISEGEAVAWRGPMVHQTIEQLMKDTDFSGGDYMIIDMPPGTGDVQITVSQLTAAYGAVVVCTPQDVALIDARRAMAMLDKVDISILGIIENMGVFVCPKCSHESEVFGNGGAEKEAESFKVDFLGRLPIDIEIRKGTDNGNPLVYTNAQSLSTKIFIEMATKLANRK